MVLSSTRKEESWMEPAFEGVLLHAVSLLRELPHGREDVRDARSQLECFRATHPGVRADLLLDQPPGSPQVDYDLLLEHPDGGTVALSWRADDATPWSVAYADHWAANYVLSVNDHAVTVQQVLLFLKLAGDEYPNLMTEVVDQTLIAQVMGESLPLVNGKERRAATDEFRNANHLCGADAMRRWLKDTGLSAARFEELVKAIDGYGERVESRASYPRR